MNKEHDEMQQIAFYFALPSGSLAAVPHDPQTRQLHIAIKTHFRAHLRSTGENCGAWGCGH